MTLEVSLGINSSMVGLRYEAPFSVIGDLRYVETLTVGTGASPVHLINFEPDSSE